MTTLAIMNQMPIQQLLHLCDPDKVILIHRGLGHIGVAFTLFRTAADAQSEMSRLQNRGLRIELAKPKLGPLDFCCLRFIIDTAEDHIRIARALKLCPGFRFLYRVRRDMTQFAKFSLFEAARDAYYNLIPTCRVEFATVADIPPKIRQSDIMVRGFLSYVAPQPAEPAVEQAVEQAVQQAVEPMIVPPVGSVRSTPATVRALLQRIGQQDKQEAKPGKRLLHAEGTQLPNPSLKVTIFRDKHNTIRKVVGLQPGQQLVKTAAGLRILNP